MCLYSVWVCVFPRCKGQSLQSFIFWWGFKIPVQTHWRDMRGQPKIMLTITAVPIIWAHSYSVSPRDKFNITLLARIPGQQYLMSQFENICPFVVFVNIWLSNWCFKKIQPQWVDYLDFVNVHLHKTSLSTGQMFRNRIHHTCHLIILQGTSFLKSSGPKQHVPKPHLTSQSHPLYWL